MVNFDARGLSNAISSHRLWQEDQTRSFYSLNYAFCLEFFSLVNVVSVPLREHSLIAGQSLHERYVTNCFRNEIPKTVDLSDFIDAFYKTPLFRLERLVLSLATTGRMRDVDITALSKGQVDRISVWQVETRLDAQILLSAGGTKSWLMVDG